MRPNRGLPLLVAALAGIAIYFVAIRDAQAVPSFARKYQTSCQTCHTIYPVLNPFGEAFRRNGYRFPSQNGSEDSDAEKAPTIPLGQDEYKKTFPNSVWPDRIAEQVPFSMMFNGNVAFNIPGSDAKNAAGNMFPWSGLLGEMHLFGAGAFNDTLTYMTQVTLGSDGSMDLETGYLLWNDIAGPRHLVNLWVGRLWAPQLTSYGLHSDYLADTVMPATSVSGLWNPSATLAIGQAHNDGVELNGIAGHRFNYALGWIASSMGNGIATQPNAEDVYVHLGVKSGGVALDGEGKYGPNVPDPRKPWAEKSITFDLFAYHGITRLDNGTGVNAGPIMQDDQFNVAGAVAHGQLDSAMLMVGAQIERHDAPYQGTAATALGGNAFPGVPSFANATAALAYGEFNYVVWPWFVPGVRAEYTNAEVPGASAAQLLRLIPGITVAVRPNIKVVLAGDLEWGQNLPWNGPNGAYGSWGPAGGSINPCASSSTGTCTGSMSKFEAEQINATVAVAF